MYTKSMLVGILLAAAMGLAPVWAADESDALRSDSRALNPVQERTKLLPLSPEQLDSVKRGSVCVQSDCSKTQQKQCQKVGNNVVCSVG
jgi:hypothetical protein